MRTAGCTRRRILRCEDLLNVRRTARGLKPLPICCPDAALKRRSSTKIVGLVLLVSEEWNQDHCSWSERRSKLRLYDWDVDVARPKLRGLSEFRQQLRLSEPASLLLTRLRPSPEPAVPSRSSGRRLDRFRPILFPRRQLNPESQAPARKESFRGRGHSESSAEKLSDHRSGLRAACPSER